MQWETKEVLVTVKAYPEFSTKHGEIVCVAGVTQENEFIRLYPVPFENFRGKNKIKKYTWIKVQCKKAEDYLGRKESYKLRPDSIEIVDDTLTQYVKGRAPWDLRNEVILPLVSLSLEDLFQKFEEDRTSLGIVKVHDLIDFFSSEPLDDVERERSKIVQKTLFGEKRTLLERVPHIFRYKFKCCDNCETVHNISIEDWEVFESFRSWSEVYPDNETLWEKLYQKYYTEFKEKNLHFYMGTHSHWPSWMIIGAYYPPL